MIGRESGKSTQREWDTEEWDRVQRRSFVWPLVATFMTALAVGHVISLKRRLLNFERHARQAYSTRHGNSNRDTDDHTYRTYDSGRFYRRESFSRRDKGRIDEPWSRMWREGFPDTEDFERLERIRRMQAAFHRERASYTRSYEKWQEGARTGGQGDQQAGREDWYWGRADWEAWCNANRGRFESPQSAQKSPLAHHHDVLGLDLSRVGTFSQDEIKAAFRAKAMQYHPDRNQHRKDFAEEKFREVVSSYEALKK